MITAFSEWLCRLVDSVGSLVGYEYDGQLESAEGHDSVSCK